MGQLRARGDTQDPRDKSFDQVNVALPVFVDRDRDVPREQVLYGAPIDADGTVGSGYGIRKIPYTVETRGKRGRKVKETRYKDEAHWAVDYAANANVVAPEGFDVLFIGEFDKDSGTAVMGRVRKNGEVISFSHITGIDPNLVVGSYVARGQAFARTGQEGRTSGADIVHVRLRKPPSAADVLSTDIDGVRNSDLIGNLIQRAQLYPNFSLEDTVTIAQRDIRNYRDTEFMIGGQPNKKNAIVKGATPIYGGTEVPTGTNVAPLAIMSKLPVLPDKGSNQR